MERTQQEATGAAWRRDCCQECGFFTLVELLIVIAVIAVLAALLFPALKLAKDKALEAGCANNLKQVGLGLLLYSNDFDGWTPYTYDAVALGWNVVLWKNSYLPEPKYYQSTPFVCPAIYPYTFFGWSRVYGLREFGQHGEGGQTYCYINLGRSPVVFKNDYGTSTAETPSRCAMAADTSDDTSSGKVCQSYAWTSATFYNYKSKVYAGHHNSANISFADGHVSGNGPAGLRELGIPDFYFQNGKASLY